MADKIRFSELSVLDLNDQAWELRSFRALELIRDLRGLGEGVFSAEDVLNGRAGEGLRRQALHLRSQAEQALRKRVIGLARRKQDAKKRRASPVGIGLAT